jgi:hypothetical protein
MNVIWNAHVSVEGFPLGLGWGITDDKTGPRSIYDAVITLTLPEGADATITKTAPHHERVVVNPSASLTCGPNGIEANVTYRVSAQPGAKGSQVRVNVAEVAGQKTEPTGDVLVQGTGLVGQDITVHFVIPGTCG